MKLKQAFTPFQYRQFRYQYAGFSVSVFGNMVSLVALTLGLLEATGSGATAGIALGASTIPLMAFLLIGGVWGDRVPRHRVMATMDGVRALAQLGVGIMLLVGEINLLLLIVLQMLFGTAQAFHLPASSGVTGFTVPKDQMQRANSLLSMTRGIATIIGPLVAGALVATVGAGWAMTLDGLTFVCSAWFALLLKLPPREPQPDSNMLKELGDGFRLVRTTPWIWTSIAVITCTHIGLGAFMIVGPVVARDQGGSAFSWSVVIAALGVGGVVGDILLLRYQPRRPILVGRLAELLLLPALLLVALGAPLAVQVVAVALAGVGTTASDSLWVTTLQSQVPDESLSKVSSYDWLCSMVPRPIGYALGAAVSVGGAAVVLCTMALVAAVSGLASLTYPSVRQLRTPAESVTN
ncbi:MFS transporter [Streptomyces triticagri]|nr:MFS transporter [Streptomyces triticagri]